MLTQKLNPNAPGDSEVLECTSRGGLNFKVIAKNRKWGKDFWNDLVGPPLDSGGIHKTFDVKYIDLSQLGAPPGHSRSEARDLIQTTHQPEDQAG